MCRFAGVAAQWSAALLEGCAGARQGVDLFGRDALLLGRVLTCLVRTACRCCDMPTVESLMP